jgi:hypothetical protein
MTFGVQYAYHVLIGRGVTDLEDGRSSRCWREKVVVKDERGY